ncbi:hypothetical protein NE591_15120, partial [Adlercreutzia sp. DFI.6.23]|nr:hypothetical protein [Adlercreutzia sp. DFI.6.23]
MAENDEKAAEAAPKKDGRPVITRRALCVGLGGTAALVGLGAVRYRGLFSFDVWIRTADPHLVYRAEDGRRINP